MLTAQIHQPSVGLFRMHYIIYTKFLTVQTFQIPSPNILAFSPLQKDWISSLRMGTSNTYNISTFLCLTNMNIYDTYFVILGHEKKPLAYNIIMNLMTGTSQKEISLSTLTLVHQRVYGIWHPLLIKYYWGNKLDLVFLTH